MSVSRYAAVACGNFLTEERDEVLVEPEATYDLVGIYSWGEGLFRRGSIRGSDTKYRRLTRLRSGQLVFSRLNAWEGALAVVPENLAGTYVSQEYPTFRLARSVDPGYISWLCRWPYLWKALHPRGSMVRRKRTHPQRLLDVDVPLPDLTEQQRVSARLTELVYATETASQLRNDASREAEAIFDSALTYFWSASDAWPLTSLGELAEFARGHVDPRVEPFAGMPHISGAAIESITCRLLPYRTAREDGVTSGKFRFPPGAVLYSKIRPYLRKATQVTVEGVCSADVYPFVSFDERILPRFFMYSLVAPPFTRHATAVSGRTRMPKINQTQLERFELAYPPLAEQEHTVKSLDKLGESLTEIRQTQREAQTELDAVMPALLDKAFAGRL